MLVVAQHIVTQPAIFVKEYQILGRFLKLTLPRFSRAPGEDAYEFVVTCNNKIYNFRPS